MSFPSESPRAALAAYTPRWQRRKAPSGVIYFGRGSCRVRRHDAVVLFSQDQDFVEVALEVRAIAQAQRRWLKIASAFPAGEGALNRRGVDRTDWLPIDRTTYEACLRRRR